MKAAFVLAAATVATAAIGSFANSEDGFAQWAEHNNAKFTIGETFERFHIWKGNYAIVTQHNKEADAGLHTFRLGMNSMSAMSYEEYKKKLNYQKKNKPTGIPVGVFDPSTVAAAAIPKAVDWRTATSPKLVSPIKAQGGCGSCWAFSAVEAMESAAAVHTNKTVRTGSPQQLVDCVLNGTDNCNSGGESHDGFLDVIKRGGLDTEVSYPYKGRSFLRHCMFKPKDIIPGTDSFVGYKQIKVGSEADLQAASVLIPTISIAMDASSNKFQLYASGVYNVPTCATKNEDLDHAVAVVGYGVYTNSSTNSLNVPYWLVKNSWNTDWGIEGYIYMSKDDKNQCGVATDASFPVYTK